MRILVIDQCSGSKNYPDGSVVYTAEDIDASGREALVARDESVGVEAKSLYAGRQQRYIGEAIDSLRALGHTGDRCFVSAGFGVVDEDERLPPYEVTFNDYSASEIDERAEQLEIPSDIQDCLSSGEPYDVVFFALGSKYYRAIDLDAALASLPTETIAVLFNQEEQATTAANVISLPARTAEAKEHGTIVVALKGVYLKHFAEHLSHGEEVTSAADVRSYCLSEYTDQTGLGDF